MGWRTVVATCVGSACALAQDVAPTAGVVRDLDQAPAAGVQVHAVALVERAAPDPSHRLRARSARDGTFTLPLAAGMPHCVWAVSDVGAGGACRVAEPRIVVPGRPVQLVLAHRRSPTVVDVAGASQWAREGPLSLRVLVAGIVPVGDDLPVPGDGLLRLPVAPCDQVALALRTGTGEALDVVRVDLGAAAPCARFASPREVDVRVEDAGGNGAAGARLLQSTGGSAPLLRPWPHDSRAPDRLRVLATSGTDGTARLRVAVPDAADGCVLLRAAREMPPGPASGWAGPTRIAAGLPASGDGVLRVVLADAAARMVRLRGELASSIELAVRERLPFGRLPLASTRLLPRDGDAWTLSSATGGAADVVALSPHGTTAPLLPVPLPSPVPAELDLAALRRFDVRCVDDAGKPFGTVELALGTVAALLPDWVGVRVTDTEGRATALLPGGSWLLCAVGDDASGAVVVDEKAQSGPIELRLQPLATRRLRVVDSKGRPVSGARVRMLGGGQPGRPRGPAELALAKVEFHPSGWRFAHATDDRGALTLRYLELPRGTLQLRAERGDAASAPFPLQGDGEATVVLETPR